MKTPEDASRIVRPDVEEHAPAIRTALLKAVMARAEPGRFIVADDRDNDDVVERSAMRAISVLDDSLAERLVPRVNRLLRNQPNARRMMGVNVTRNLREPLRIKRIWPRVTLRPPQQQERAGAAPPQTVYTRALVELRAVHCLRITEPRDNPDEMVLGTVLRAGHRDPVRRSHGGRDGRNARQRHRWSRWQVPHRLPVAYGGIG